MIDIKEFTRHYLIAALWSSHNEQWEHDDSVGEYLDMDYNLDDIAPELWEQAGKDCAKFVDDNMPLLLLGAASCGTYDIQYMGGHDFWLTRNGHGVGFWDRGLGEHGDALTKAAEQYGPFYLWADGGKVYGERG